MKATLLFIFSFISLLSHSQTIGITTFASGFVDPLEQIYHRPWRARIAVIPQVAAIAQQLGDIRRLLL